MGKAAEANRRGGKQTEQQPQNTAKKETLLSVKLGKVRMAFQNGRSTVRLGN